MWIRFKKRTKPGYTKYHFFSEYVSVCGKEVRRKDTYGRARTTQPDRELTCPVCYRKKANQ